LFVVTILGCTKVSTGEVSRVTSSDGKVDAILVRGNVDATVPTPYELYIAPKGGKPIGQPVMRGDKFDSLKVAWREPRFLELHYSKGRVFSFTNFWQSADLENWTYIVELRLKPDGEARSLE
jgi:hypothetical protein